MRFPGSLRWRFAIAMMVIVAGALGLQVAESMRIARASLTEQARLHLRTLEPLLAAAVTAPLAERDFATLEHVLGEAIHRKGIRYVVVSDARGERISAIGLSTTAKLPRPTAGPPALSPDDGEYHGRLELHFADQRIGELRYGMSLDVLNEGLVSLRDRGLVLGILAIVLSLGVILATTIWFTRRLAMLTQSSAALASGQFDVALPEHGSDEVTGLIRAFNVMAQAVRERIDELTLAEAQQAEAMSRLRLERERTDALLAALGSGILMTGPNGHVIYCNPAFHRLFRLDPGTRLLGLDIANLAARSTMRGHLLVELRDALPTAGAPPEDPVGQEMKTADGVVLWRKVVNVCDRDANVVGRLWVFDDITHKREAERLSTIAERDALTGLFNRRRFSEELARAVTIANQEAQPFAVLFIDLDGFKGVNDKFGHKVGDQVLIGVARELHRCLRATDVLARLGGDEFAVVMPRTTLDIASSVADRIVAAVPAIRFEPSNRTFPIGASIGIAVFPEDGLTPDQLVECADVAMYAAKRAGRHTWRAYQLLEAGARDLAKPGSTGPQAVVASTR